MNRVVNFQTDLSSLHARDFPEVCFWDQILEKSLATVRNLIVHSEGKLESVVEALGAAVLRSSTCGTDERQLLLDAAACLVLVESSEENKYEITLAGSDPGALAAVQDKIVQCLPPMEVEDDRVHVRFLSNGSGSRLNKRIRKLTAPAWSDIRENYARNTQEKLDRLMRMERPEGLGKLLLFRGVQGTGKTYATRAMAREWKKWCRLNYVLDPERFFGDPQYMLESVLGDHDDYELEGILGRKEEDRWDLFVMEDANEFLAIDAKFHQGQSFARLLNLVEGLIGQGLKVLVLITTNEELKDIHPAVSRVGRCLMDVEFGAFGREEASAWLARQAGELDADIPGAGLTLAELYGWVSDLDVKAPVRLGLAR